MVIVKTHRNELLNILINAKLIKSIDYNVLLNIGLHIYLIKNVTFRQ